MDARDILTPIMRRLHIRDDLVEMHRCRILDDRPLRRTFHRLFRHQRTGIEAHRAAFDQSKPANGDEIRRAGTGADEIDCHASTFFMPLSVFPE